jgi:HD-GYP domain-containing protein (c-di-GMP phosphodiesterase class II)
MLRSKQISDYIEADLKELLPGTKLPVDVHLYFTSNRHILVWRKAGEVIGQTLLAKYKKRGMRKLWVHRDDEDKWRAYLAQAAAEVAAGDAAEEPAGPATRKADLDAMIADVDAGTTEPRTEEGREMLEILENPNFNERQRTALAARAARDVLAETVLPRNTEDPEARQEAIAHARDTVRDILDSVLADAAAEVRKIIGEMWDLSTIDPELTHAVNVASFAVLFAMAFGRISQEVLADIALAALLHDVGLTQVPAHIARIPWTHQQGRERQIYSRHVDEGLRLIDDLAGELSPRVKPLIQQHHEKFDGSGYPMQLQGFQVNDVAQLVAMADTLESMACGQWDGELRSLQETFDRVEKLEKSRNYPEYFNPEVFAAVTKWIRNPGSVSSKMKASDIVRSTTRELMKRKA